MVAVAELISGISSKNCCSSLWTVFRAFATKRLELAKETMRDAELLNQLGRVVEITEQFLKENM